MLTFFCFLRKTRLLLRLLFFCLRVSVVSDHDILLKLIGSELNVVCNGVLAGILSTNLIVVLKISDETLSSKTRPFVIVSSIVVSYSS